MFFADPISLLLLIKDSVFPPVFHPIAFTLPPPPNRTRKLAPRARPGRGRARCRPAGTYEQGACGMQLPLHLDMDFDLPEVQVAQHRKGLGAGADQG